MTLQERLNEQKAKSAARIPKEAREVMHRAVEAVRQSGILERVLRVGARAPEWSLPDHEGRTVDSKGLLAKGPLVLSFYRGRW